MIWIVFSMLVVVAFYTAATYRHVGLLNAVGIFLWFQLIMAIGAVPMLDSRSGADRTHALLMLSTFLVTAVTGWAVQFRRGEPPINLRSSTAVAVAVTRGMWALVAVAMGVCTLYYLALGHNLLIDAILPNARSGYADVAEARFAAYSGSKYLFPGYVNQFKNALLPALSLVIAWSAIELKMRARWFVAALLLVINLVFILGTGQRGAFVTFVLVCSVYLYQVDRPKFPRRVGIVAMVGVPLFLVSTAILGRGASEMNGASGLLDRAGVAFGQITSRIFGSNQSASVEGFRYIYEQPTQNGAEWILAFKGLLPGVSGSDLENRIYEYMYGSDRGTAPLSLWGSAYHNFGLLGTIILAGVLGVILGLVSLQVIRTGSRTTLTAVGSAGVSVLLGTWVAGSPLYLLNTGIVVYTALWVWGNRSADKAEKPLESASAT